MADKQQTTNLSPPLGNDAQAETKPKVFDAQGAIGKQFTCNSLPTYTYRGLTFAKLRELLEVQLITLEGRSTRMA